jgi:hypothetical protein
MRRHRSTTFVLVSTTYFLSEAKPATTVSVQKSPMGDAGKSSMNLT